MQRLIRSLGTQRVFGIHRNLLLLGGAAISLMIAGCTVGPDYHTPTTAMPGSFSEIASATQQWWTTFNDPELTSLIERAVDGNLNLVAATSRIRQARAQRGVTAAALYPQVNATGGYTHSRTSQNVFNFGGFSGASGGTGGSGGGTAFSPVSDLYQAGFDASWEIDVFGGTRRGVESADASIQAAIEDRRDVLVTLMSEVAVNYVQLRGAQRALVITEDNLKSQQDTLSLTRSKAEGGVSPYLDVAQQEAQVATTAAQIPTLNTQIRQNIHQLGLLLGRDPGALSDELTPVAPIPVGPASVPPGVPSDLLRRRPDIRRAERQLASQTALIGAATADLYPKFSITGALGDESQQLHHLFDYSSRFYSIAPGVSWAIFDAGRIRSNIKVQNELQVQALANYEQTVLQSMQEVDDALVAYNQEQVRLQSLRDAVEANQKAVDLSKELFDKGSKDFLSVLDAERNLFAAQSEMAISEQQVSANLISLYKALGGGWQ
jgi:NodT family efflux transporter outer membrane factor (OMF) lipoprotein